MNTAMKKSKQIFGQHELKEPRKEALFAELHALLSAGLDFSHAFGLLIAGERDEATRHLLQQLFAAVVRGEALCTALEGSGRFSALDCGVVRIGEETGRLDEALEFLADYYRRRVAQRRMVSGAVSYPLVILGTAVVVVIFMVLVIVPMFEQVYSRLGGELPALTRWIIALSRSFPQQLAVGGLILAGAVALYLRFRERDAVQRATAAVLLRLPFVGEILRRNYQASFCKLLYLLTRSGVPLLRGVDMLQGIITFWPYRQSLRDICTGLGRGELFADAMARHTAIYGVRLLTLIRVGEQTGRLPEMLRKQADDLSARLEHSLKQLGTMLEPLLILLVGVLVAVVLIAMYMPMFKLGSAFN
ncbi:MAG: type II secretion system F family protein [Rikenellaceae bacterium]|nr:type II secretion system F family protein [Rikenellaceae bacterium]